MKKFNIIRDKKLFYYMLIYTVLVYAVVISTLTAQVNNTINQSYSTILLIFVKVILILYITLLNYFIVKDLLVRFDICEEYLTYGTLGWGEIRYDKIDSIYFDKDIILIKKNKKKKLRVFNLDENKDKYIALLTKIKENINYDFSINEGMKTLEYYNNYDYREEGKPLRLNGWLFVIFIQMIVLSSASIFMLLTTALAAVLPNSTTSTTDPITTFITLALGVIVAIFMAKKHIFASRMIVIFYLTQIIITIINPILKSSYDISQLSYSISYFATQLFFALIVIRYMKISKRVSYTFIYDKFRTVEKINRIKDPGFKLFAKEPSSLYGIFAWLLVPAFAAVSIVITIIALIVVAFI